MNIANKIAVINTGSELLKGSAVNSNLAFLGNALLEIGANISVATTVADDNIALYDALYESTQKANIIIVSGGLGSTKDDLTREAVCRFFGVNLVESQELRKRLLYLWRVRHGKGSIPKHYFRQALLPERGSYLPNANGSAVGLHFIGNSGGNSYNVFMLPGPPFEFETMVKDELLVILKDIIDKQVWTNGFLAVKTGELELEKIAIENLDENITKSYCSSAFGSRFFLTSNNKDEINSSLEKIRSIIGDNALNIGELDLTEYILKLLRKNKKTLSTAESCTGGMIASKLVDIAGCSDVFLGGSVVYSNALKQSQLGVKSETLNTFGAVSKECVHEMGLGACKNHGSDFSIATSGIAGPDGGSEEKVVGLTYIGVCFDNDVRVEEFIFRGGRTTIRNRATATALIMLFEELVKRYGTL